MKNILHIILSVICLLCLAEVVSFVCQSFCEAETLTWYHYIMQPLSILGWLYICWAELRHKRVTLLIMRKCRRTKSRK